MFCLVGGAALRAESAAQLRLSGKRVPRRKRTAVADRQGTKYMTTTQRRITLLAGASISALGLSSPAVAQAWYPAPAPHDNVTDGSYLPPAATADRVRSRSRTAPTAAPPRPPADRTTSHIRWPSDKGARTAGVPPHIRSSSPVFCSRCPARAYGVRHRGERRLHE